MTALLWEIFSHFLYFSSKQVIHCEHDKVATHVFRTNHDPSYNQSLPQDDIEYIYFDKFEDIESNLDAFVQAHGRKFSKVNICLQTLNDSH